MRCDEAREELLAGRAQSPAEALEQHVRSCPECAALAEEQRALDALLALDRTHPPGPGFDTRFFARLSEERAAAQKKRALLSVRMWLWALVPVAAGVALLVARPPREDKPAPAKALPPPTFLAALDEGEPDDLALAKDLELIEHLEIVQRLDELEDFELLGEIDVDELERLAAEEPSP